MELGERYRLLHISEAETVDDEAVLDFWKREGAIPDHASARERVHEVEFVGIEEPGRLVALSTAFVEWSPRLRTEIWNIRTFVGRDHRRSALGTLLLRQTRQHLEQRFVSGVETRAPGIMIRLEHPEVKRTRNEAVWPPGMHWTFIGENHLHDHVRVYWFPGAHAPLPG